MAEIAKWNGHAFVVSPTLIRSFIGLTLRGSSTVEEKTSGSECYVARKASAPTEVSFSIPLSTATGCDVFKEANQFVSEARSGAKDYFYIGGKKLTPGKLMLVEASVSEVQIAPGGQWISCTVQVRLQQASKKNGATGGTSRPGSGGSRKTSVRRKKVSGGKTGVTIPVAGALTGALTAVGNVSKTVAAANAEINRIIRNNQSAKRRRSSASGGGSASKITYSRLGL